MHNRLGKTLTSILAVVSGILLFNAAAAASLEAGLFNSSFHLKLINKYGIYSQLEQAAANSLKHYVNGVKSGTGENDKQKDQLFSLVNSAITPDMVKLNTDALIRGLMEYFSGEVLFLPDVYLKAANVKPSSEPDGTVDQTSPGQRQPLAGIDRISLSVLLMYMDRYDVINTFSEIRLVKFALSYAPVFLTLLSMLLFVLSAVFAGGREVKTRLSQAILAAGLSGISASFILFIPSLFYLPVYPGSSGLTKYIDKDALYGYLRACFERPAIPLAAFSIAILSALPISRLLPKAIPGDIVRKLSPRIVFIKKYVCFPVPDVSKKYAKALAGIILLIALTGALAVKAEAMKGDFHSKDLGAALERLRGVNPYTKIIAARDGIIYSVEVRTVERDSGQPVQGLEMFLDGSPDGGNAYSESGASDSLGKTRFYISKGSFKLEFDPSKFPENYKIPAPYPFEIKMAGTTIITVSLEKAEAKKPGIAELLILGAGNKPLENLELVAEGEGDGIPAGKTFSFTNRDGIAVFQLPEGRYRISFPEASFPGQYIPPAPFEIETASGETADYSLKLAAKEPPAKSKKNGKK